MGRKCLEFGLFSVASLLAAVASAEPRAIVDVGGDGLAGLLGDLETPLDDMPSTIEAPVSDDGGRVVRVAVARGASVVVGAGALLEAWIDGTRVWSGPGPVEAVAIGGTVAALERASVRWSFRSAGGVTLGGVEAGRRIDLVADAKGVVAIEPVALEDYVASVVGAEMPASWPAAALEAQAIAARTFVLRKLERVGAAAAWDVQAGVIDQAYKGRASLDPRTRAAAEATRGLVLRHGERLAEAYFHALCVGRTETAAAAFGAGPEYLRAVDCRAPAEAPYASWEKRFDLAELGARFKAEGVLGDTLRKLEVATRTSSGRIERVRLVTKGGARVIGGGELRRLLGWDALPSLDADIEMRGNAAVFKGRGRGHGVGLCQWCAKGMAGDGTDARSILAHFYPQTTVDPLALP